MSHQFTLVQAASAMNTTTENLKSLLAACGDGCTGDRLTTDQLQTLEQYLESEQERSRRRAQEQLEKLTERCTLLIDTCSLLNDGFPLLMEHLGPLLRQHGRTLLVPSGVLGELKNLFPKKPELRQRIAEIVQSLAALRDAGLVKVCGDSSAAFGDKQLLGAVIQLRPSTELLVITQDNGLSADLLGMNGLTSVLGKRISVYRINRYGYLSRFLSQEERFGGSSSVSSAGSTNGASDAHAAPLPVTAPLPIKDNRERLPVAHQVPVEGTAIRCGEHTMVLGKLLASGGEGKIYELEDGSVAKLYRPEKLTVGRRDKLALMVANPVACPGVCWPRDLLYSTDGDFLGYRMDHARGVELQRSVFTRSALESHFPDWKRKDTVQLCVSILEKLAALHNQGIILGDINPLNILVASSTEVWFVDCDSYQIGGYPCPVGTVRFTAPEIQKRDFSTFLRTAGNESFAVATLLFMIMLPGKSPYAQQGGDDLSSVIQAMDFPYPCGDKHADKTPEGAWRFLWSHLPRYIKEYFYGTFRRGGAYSTESARLTVEQWLDAFRYYLNLLTEGTLQKQDPLSGEIFPNRWKIVDPDARTVWQSPICADCGEQFDLMVSERDYYQRHALALPRRCPACRKLRKLSHTSFSVNASA